MALEIDDGLFCCLIGEQLVFLALIHDRYLCLPKAENDTLRERLENHRGNLEVEHLPAALQPFVSINGPTLSLTEVPNKPDARSSIFDNPRLPSAISAIAEAIMRQAWAEKQLKTRLLPALLARLKRRKAVNLQPSTRSDQLQKIAMAFRASRLLINNHDKCLSRSIAMADSLITRRYSAQFIIGVKLRPFTAHAWVQDEHEVLNDELDNVLGYTPILVI